MRPIIKYNSRLVPKGYAGMTLWPFILIRYSKEETPFSLVVHELTHFLQAKRKFVIGFYFLYVVEFLINLIRFRDFFEAYWNISYEVEARDNEERWENYERDFGRVSIGDLITLVNLFSNLKDEDLEDD